MLGPNPTHRVLSPTPCFSQKEERKAQGSKWAINSSKAMAGNACTKSRGSEEPIVCLCSALAPLQNHGWGQAPGPLLLCIPCAARTVPTSSAPGLSSCCPPPEGSCLHFPSSSSVRAIAYLFPALCKYTGLPNRAPAHQKRLLTFFSVEFLVDKHIIGAL